MKISRELAPMWVASVEVRVASYENKWHYHKLWTEEQYEGVKKHLREVKEWYNEP